MGKQAEQHKKWWQKIQQHPVMTAVIIVAGVLVTALIIVIVLGYWFNWPWVGVNGGESKITIISISKGTSTTTELQPTKTLWDWLGLLGVLAIPVVVAFGVAWYTNHQTKSEKDLADKRAEFEQTIHMDKLREELLQRYFDDMLESLLKENLLKSEPFDPVSAIARARTLAVLHRVTPVRKGLVLQFLLEAKLIDKDKPIVGLRGADLRGANLRGVNLCGANLHGADLSLDSGDHYAHRHEANLEEADLSNANLEEANLSNADLMGTILFNANLSNAILEGANLNKAWVTREQVSKARSLQGATMPDGSIHP